MSFLYVCVSTLYIVVGGGGTKGASSTGTAFPSRTSYLVGRNPGIFELDGKAIIESSML
jgi:hypothetical protein